MDLNLSLNLNLSAIRAVDILQKEESKIKYQKLLLHGEKWERKTLERWRGRNRDSIYSIPEAPALPARKFGFACEGGCILFCCEFQEERNFWGAVRCGC